MKKFSQDNIRYKERMKTMKTIGLPKALLYYHYHILWKTFFDALKVPYVESKKTTREMLEKGKEKCIDETCLSMKIFLGHIASIKNQCDCILIPRIYSIEKKEQVCTNFNALYDLVRNVYPKVSIINYNVDVKHHHSEENGFIHLGKQLGFSKKESKNAYKIAKKKEKEHNQLLEDQGRKKMQSKKTKILLLGHPYNLEDDLIGKRIISYLKDKDIEIIYSYEVPKEKVNTCVQKISPKVHWTMNKELLASFIYFKDHVDGTILLTAFPCGPDSLTNEMILRKKRKNKVLLLTFEDLNSDVAILTRLESFLDMLKGGIHL